MNESEQINNRRAQIKRELAWIQEMMDNTLELSEGDRAVLTAREAQLYREQNDNPNKD